MVKMNGGLTKAEFWKSPAQAKHVPPSRLTTSIFFSQYSTFRRRRRISASGEIHKHCDSRSYQKASVVVNNRGELV